MNEQQPQLQVPFGDLDETLRRFADALSQIPSDKLILKEEEIRIDIGEKSYILFTAPLGDVIAEYTDKVAAGRPFSELLRFLFSRCLKKYHIEAGGIVLDGKDVNNFLKRVSPAVIMYAALKLLQYIRDVQFAGLDVNQLFAPPQTETVQVEVEEIPIE